MGRLRANLPTVVGAPATSYVIPNTRAVTDNFTLEYATGEFYNITDPLTVVDAETTYPSITFVENLFIQLETEILRVTDVDSPDVTFARAQLETGNTWHAENTDVYVEDWVDTTDDTAGGDFNNTTDPLTVTIADYPGTDFTVGAVLLIESEKLLVTDNDGTDATLARGQFGTSAAAHADAEDIFQLTFTDSGDDVAADVYTTVPSDEYRVAPYTGYLVKRALDDDAETVDWSDFIGERFFWSGTLVAPAGQVGITREQIEWFDEVPPPPVDAEGALNLELSYYAIVDTLVAGGNAFTANFEGGTVEVLGVATNQRAIKFKKNNVLVARISAYKDDAGGAHSLNIDTQRVQDEGSYSDVSVDAPAGQIASNRLTVLKDGATVGKFEIISTDSEVDYAYLSDVSGLMLNGSDPPEISDGFGVDIDGKILRLRTSKTPSSASDMGNAGEICWDANYLYVCIANATWRRIAHATW